MVRPYLSVVIPAFNEARRLPLTLIDLDRHLSAREFSYDITVVVSPGTDNTLEILKRFEAIIKNFKVIPLQENQGRGLAVKTGMLAAKGNWRLVLDADNSVSIIEFEKMEPHLKDYDVAIGSRYLPGSHIDPPAPVSRRLLERIGRWCIKTFIVRQISDTTCGFKCFSAAASDKIFSQVKNNGWALDSEALKIAQKLNYKIREIPIFYSYDSGSHRTPRSYLKIIGEYLSLWAQR